MYETGKNEQYRFRGGYKYGSYAANHAYYDEGLWSPSGVSIAAIDAPSSTVWAVDSTPAAVHNVFAFEFSWATRTSQPAIATGSPNRLGAITERHLDTTNVLFCDGHVKSLKLSNLMNKSTSGVTNGAYSYFTIQDD